MRFLRIFVFFICVSSIFAADKLKFVEKLDMGIQPIAVNFDSKTNMYHIFCNGDDKNYNGKIDSGDIAPSWWTLKYENDMPIKTKVKEFTNGYFRFPLRVDFLDAYDFSDRLVYIPFTDEVEGNKVIKSGYIQSFSLDDYKVVDDNVCGFKGEAVASYGPHLLIPKNPADGSDGEVVVFNLATKKPLQTIKAGKLVQEAKAFSTTNGKLMLAAYSLGSNSADSSTLHIAEVPHTQDFTFTNIKIGKTPNHLATYQVNDKETDVVITLNESHEIFFLHGEDPTEMGTLKTNTTGFNGPRETALTSDKQHLLVSTYNNEMLLLKVGEPNFTSTKLDSTMSAKFEGMYANSGEKGIVVASPYNMSYDKSKGGVYIFQIEPGLSVEEMQAKANANTLIFPNPVRSKLKLNLSQDDLNAYFSVRITDNTGTVLYSNNQMGYTLANGLPVGDLNLNTNGCYFLTLQSANNSIISSPFIYLSE